VAAVSQQLQALSAAPESVLAARRLCLVLAAAAVRTGADATVGRCSLTLSNLR